MKKSTIIKIIIFISIFLLGFIPVICNAYDGENEFGFIKTILLQSCVLGFLVSTIICIIIGFKHKPVKVSKNANQYLDLNSVNISERYDHFTNYTITKIPLYKK